MKRSEDSITEGADVPSGYGEEIISETESAVDTTTIPDTNKDFVKTVADNTEASTGSPKKMPCRFRTAFILFSSHRHKQIREQLGARGMTEKTANVAKMVSGDWRNLSREEKEIWDAKAREDKTRYEGEMSEYMTSVRKNGGKDADVPKRPMSAYLAYSNKRRAALKRMYPDATNAELSKMLASAWKSAPPDVKAEYVEQEARLRAAYNNAIMPFRNKKSKKPRKQRAAAAVKVAAATKKHNTIRKETTVDAFDPQQLHNRIDAAFHGEPSNSNVQTGSFSDSRGQQALQQHQSKLANTLNGGMDINPSITMSGIPDWSSQAIQQNEHAYAFAGVLPYGGQVGGYGDVLSNADHQFRMFQQGTSGLMSHGSYGAPASFAYAPMPHYTNQEQQLLQQLQQGSSRSQMTGVQSLSHNQHLQGLGGGGATASDHFTMFDQAATRAAVQHGLRSQQHHQLGDNLYGQTATTKQGLYGNFAPLRGEVGDMGLYEIDNNYLSMAAAATMHRHNFSDMQ